MCGYQFSIIAEIQSVFIDREIIVAGALRAECGNSEGKLIAP